MDNIELYFDNLLFNGKDIDGDLNKEKLTQEEQNAIEICAAYVVRAIFPNRDFLKMYYENQSKVIDFLYNSEIEGIK